MSPGPERKEARWRLRLYVVGDTFKSRRAIARVKTFCENYLEADDCQIEIIDLLKEPARAREDQILAVPALIRLEPLPVRKILGDLSDETVVLEAFEIERMSPSNLP